MTFRKPRGFGNAKFKAWAKVPDATKQYLEPFRIDSSEPVDGALTELTNRLGDERLAKRVRTLQAQYPAGTVPELVTMDWLDKQRYRYIYQAQLWGGRAAAGGLLPDFVVASNGAIGQAWQIQGEYWHGKKGLAKQSSDAAAALTMTGQVVDGIRIEKVMNLWESDIYNRRPEVFEYALAGIGLR